MSVLNEEMMLLFLQENENISNCNKFDNYYIHLNELFDFLNSIILFKIEKSI